MSNENYWRELESASRLIVGSLVHDLKAVGAGDVNISYKGGEIFISPREVVRVCVKTGVAAMDASSTEFGGASESRRLRAAVDSTLRSYGFETLVADIDFVRRIHPDFYMI